MKAPRAASRAVAPNADPQRSQYALGSKHTNESSNAKKVARLYLVEIYGTFSSWSETDSVTVFSLYDTTHCLRI
jgi:hypothetical protein